MRIIHTADLHLESSFIRLTPEQVKERKLELYSAFTRMVDEAVRLGARLFIIAGDLFDTEKITKRAAERVTSVIERHPEIDFLYLQGNHEGSAFLDKISVMPRNLRTFGDGWTSYDYGDVTVVGRNTLSEGMFGELRLNPERHNIAVLHGAVREYSGAGDGISLPDAARCGIGYLALGHYHAYGEYRLDGGGYAVYSGSPEGRGFDETGEHGFVVIDTDTGKICPRFVPSAKRRVHAVEVDISEAHDTLLSEDAVAAAVRDIPSSDLIRVILVGERAPEARTDTDRIAARFKDRFYYFEVKDATRVKIDPMSYAYDKSLKGEFIRMVYSRTDLTDEMRTKIIKCGISALMGEELEV